MFVSKDTKTYSCGCVGPQNGDPLCPCAMRSVVVEDGRYVQRIDLGPAKAPKEKADVREALKLFSEYSKYG